MICARQVVTDLTQQPQRCAPSLGNPILPLTGAKREVIATNLNIGALPLRITYDSTPRAPQTNPEFDVLDFEPASFGALWVGSLHRRLTVAHALRGARVSRGDGRSVSFLGNGSGLFTAPANINDRLVPFGGGYRFVDASALAHEVFDAEGRLVSLAWARGSSLAFTYSDATTSATVAPAAGYLIAVTDVFGRSLSFEYELPVGGAAAADARVARIIDVAGQFAHVGYSGINVSLLRWPDGSVLQFMYESASHPWALTGVIDERGARRSTFGYDSEGRAVTTERAAGVDRHTVSYAQAPRVAVSDVYDATSDVVLRTRSWQPPAGTTFTTPTGASNAMSATDLFGAPHFAGQTQPAGSGCAASASATTYDSNGNVASQDDFTGVRTCHAHDLARNLELARVEGLSSSAACSGVTPAGSTLPAGSRKVSTQWHPDWRLKTRQAEPGRLTTWVYNGQPDPFNGGAVATCAPASAQLPDGKPIAVLCRQVEQATTDGDGAQGFSALPHDGIPIRMQSWTYNQHGQILVHDGPRSDVDDITAYAYYTSSTADYWVGDLRSVTNASGHTTTFTRYNRHGQLLESVDANGVMTTHTYDLRLRRTSTNVGGQTTTYAYDAAGQLTRVTQGDGSFVAYDYDAAGRNVGIRDSRGNRLVYTLDSAGNRVAEQSFDPTGALRSQLQRVFDALGRVQQTIGLE